VEDITLRKICEIIKSNKSFSIYSHFNTDIDAIGSSLALKRVLTQIGKTAHVFIDPEFPNNSKMFEDINLINNEKQKDYDVCFVLDCAEESRLGRLRYKYRKNVKTVVCVDHHLTNTIPTKNKYWKADISSSCEMVYNIINALGIKPDQETCKLLISGIYTDTGGLQFSNTYSTTYKILANLLENSGLTMDEITVPLFKSLTKEAFELKKLAYSKVELYFNDKVAFTVFTAEDFKKLKVKMSETKGFADISMQLESVKVIILASEDILEPGVYHISIRTKDNYDASKIASVFGGGGHLKASGCKILGSIEEVKTQLLEAIKKELK